MKYTVLKFDISNGLDTSVELSADYICYQFGTQIIQLRLDSESAPPINLRAGNIVEANFNELYLECDPRGETIELLVSYQSNVKMGLNDIRLVSDYEIIDVLENRCFEASCNNAKVGFPTGNYWGFHIYNASDNYLVVIEDITSMTEPGEHVVIMYGALPGGVGLNSIYSKLAYAWPFNLSTNTFTFSSFGGFFPGNFVAYMAPSLEKSDADPKELKSPFIFERKKSELILEPGLCLFFYGSNTANNQGLHLRIPLYEVLL